MLLLAESMMGVRSACRTDDTLAGSVLQSWDRIVPAKVPATPDWMSFFRLVGEY
jgi:hypothetical protein